MLGSPSKLHLDGMQLADIWKNNPIPTLVSALSNATLIFSVSFLACLSSRLSSSFLPVSWSTWAFMYTFASYTSFESLVSNSCREKNNKYYWRWSIPTLYCFVGYRRNALANTQQIHRIKINHLWMQMRFMTPCYEYLKTNKQGFQCHIHKMSLVLLFKVLNYLSSVDLSRR